MRKAKTAIMNLHRKSTFRRLRASLVLLGALGYLAAVPLSGATINLFNTGLNPSGSATLTGTGTPGGGAADTHWQCSGSSCPSLGANAFEAQSNTTVSGSPNWPLPATQNTTPGPGQWRARNTTAGAGVAGGYTGGTGAISQWISFQSDVDGEPATTAQYDYQQTFTLAGFILTTADIQGVYAVDNSLS